MEVLSTLSFPYQFLIKNNDNHSPGTSTNDKILAWCTENCKSVWIISSSAAFRAYAPILVENPLGNNQKFSPSSTMSHSVVMVAFEAEDEAMAFKLTFVDGGKGGK